MTYIFESDLFIDINFVNIVKINIYFYILFWCCVVICLQKCLNAHFSFEFALGVIWSFFLFLLSFKIYFPEFPCPQFPLLCCRIKQFNKSKSTPEINLHISFVFLPPLWNFVWIFLRMLLTVIVCICSLNDFCLNKNI